MHSNLEQSLLELDDMVHQRSKHVTDEILRLGKEHAEFLARIRQTLARLDAAARNDEQRFIAYLPDRPEKAEPRQQIEQAPRPNGPQAAPRRIAP